jgi:LacI family transcriptional regulator, repressor for deo operon, udp, cdd, tsx, nupC, and nupG
MRSRGLDGTSPPLSTIHAVARRAGVSTATVSRVLSRPDVVAPGTRLKVLQAVEHLGYAPNAAGKHLRTRRSRNILVTVPDLSNPFFAQILQGIEEAAQREGYAVLVGDTQHDAAREERYAQMLRRSEADGLIFLGHRLPPSAADLIRSAAPRRAPVVNGCEFSPALGVPGVHIDNAAAAAEAMDYLYGLGHRRIAVLTGPLDSPLSLDRLEGTARCSRRRGLEHDLVVSQGDFSIESGARAASEWLERPDRPTAAFCFNDEMAIGVIDAARRRGVRVPAELSVVGFDDVRVARYLDPPLTTIAQPMREIGAGTVALLLAILAGREPARPSVTLPHALVVRGTCTTAGSR